MASNYQFRIKQRSDHSKESSSVKELNKTPSPPKLSLLTQHMTSKLLSQKSKPLSGHYSSTSKSSNYTWTSSRRTEKTPECDRKLKKLEKSGLLTKLRSMKVTKNITDHDDEDDEDIVNNENVIDNNDENESNNNRRLFKENENDLKDNKMDKNEQKKVSSPNEEFLGYDDFGPDNGDPFVVKQIKTEAAKVSRDNYDVLKWSDKLSQQNSQISFTDFHRNHKENVSTERKQLSDENRNKYSSSSKTAPENGKSLNHDNNPYNNMIQRDLNALVSHLQKRFHHQLGSKNDDQKSKSQMIKPSSVSASSLTPKSIKESKSEKKTSKRRSKSSNARLSSSEDNFPQNKDKESKKGQNEHQCLSSSSLSSRRCQSHPNIDNAIDAKKLSSSVSSSDSLSDNSKIKVFQVNRKRYQILNCIGHGGSSKVYQVYDSETQTTMAIKIVDLSKADELTVAGYKNEINLLNKLKRCNRVVRMYDYEYKKSDNQLLVVMEKGDSDLAHVLKSFVDSDSKNSLDLHLIKFYWKEMLKAVSEIHSMGVVHADLKPVNFILVSGKLKLIDFGIANAIQSEKTSVYKEHQIGTINYMAPEALLNRSEVPGGKTIIKFNCKADIWSLGCILYNLVYGRTPFHCYNNLFAKAQAILNTQIEIQYPQCNNDLLLDCMKLCLQRDARMRPTAEDLLNHRYLSESLSGSNSSVSTSAAATSGAMEQQQLQLMSKINNLTPRRMRQLSQVVEQLSKH